jgi:hypothetical protein
MPLGRVEHGVEARSRFPMSEDRHVLVDYATFMTSSLDFLRRRRCLRQALLPALSCAHPSGVASLPRGGSGDHILPKHPACRYDTSAKGLSAWGSRLVIPLTLRDPREVAAPFAVRTVAHVFVGSEVSRPLGLGPIPAQKGIGIRVRRSGVPYRRPPSHSPWSPARSASPPWKPPESSTSTESIAFIDTDASPSAASGGL